MSGNAMLFLAALFSGIPDEATCKEQYALAQVYEAECWQLAQAAGGWVAREALRHAERRTEIWHAARAAHDPLAADWLYDDFDVDGRKLLYERIIWAARFHELAHEP